MNTGISPLAEQETLQDLSPAGVETGTEEQIAALCWRKEGRKRKVLLITSRDTGRWIVPKGWPMKGHLPHEAARIEAWEEAGVSGEISEVALGLYNYRKNRRKKSALACAVSVFPLKVANLAKDFPEKSQRRRKWFSPKKAARKVAEPELRDLILGFAAMPVAPVAKPAAESAERVAAAEAQTIDA